MRSFTWVIIVALRSEHACAPRDCADLGQLGGAPCPTGVRRSVGRFDARVAVVTGASSGIGRTIALALAAEGACVVVNYARSAARAREVADSITGSGGRALAVG